VLSSRVRFAEMIRETCSIDSSLLTGLTLYPSAPAVNLTFTSVGECSAMWASTSERGVLARTTLWPLVKITNRRLNRG
jgi:hypothetical protein